MEPLKPQIPFLGLVQLRDFNDQQQKRLDVVQRTLTRGQSAIDNAKSAVDQGLHGAKRRVGNMEVRQSHPWDEGFKRRLVEQITEIRTNIETELRPVMQKMLTAKSLAKEYATRHWTKIQVLNRADVGTGTGATDSLLRRAAYAQIFTKAGKAQLFDYGQMAVDTGDALLADCVFRSVAALPVSERPFQPAALLSLVPNEEFTEANALLNSTMEAYSAAKRGSDVFMGGRNAAVTHDQIMSGLRERQQQGIEEFDIDDVLTPEGGLREDALTRIAQRATGN